MDGTAVIFCEGSFASDYGKTAHGLVRHTTRYDVLAVIDSGIDANGPVDSGEYLDGVANGIKVVATLDDALSLGPKYFVIGYAPDGGVLPGDHRNIVLRALRNGINVDSGLHAFLSDDDELAAAAAASGATIRDIRKPAAKRHFFNGSIRNVRAQRIAVLGTDCALGKRTTATMLVQALQRGGRTAEIIGTGQTAWLQGARYGFILDSTINDFVGGELEHAIVAADRDLSPDYLVIEGQSSLTHPAGASGFELLATAQPVAVVLQHAPGRNHYSGYPDFPVTPVEAHVEAIERLFNIPVVAVATNPEGLTDDQAKAANTDIANSLAVPCVNPLRDGVAAIIEALP